MCPMCFATAALIAASAVSTGGLAAVVLKKSANGKTTTGVHSNTPKEDHDG
jgi:hypothetical protein